jgi:hypothetical protein
LKLVVIVCCWVWYENQLLLYGRMYLNCFGKLPSK